MISHPTTQPFQTMKTPLPPPLTARGPSRWRALFATAAALLLAGVLDVAVRPSFATDATATTTANSPRITAIDYVEQELVITVEVPEGVARVVLEGSNRGDLRAWQPRAVQRVSAAGLLTFRLPLAQAARTEMFRARADDTDPLPATFYTGKTQFAGEANNNGPNIAMRNGVPEVSLVVGDAAGPATPSRSVVESDIWKVSGDRLYFFNSQRGLQILDLTQPDKPLLKATYALPASGEQMYLLGEHHVVLLSRDRPCSPNWGSESQSAVLVVDVANDQPQLAARVELQGRILESRLVGSALYVATERWRTKSDVPEDSGTWVVGTEVTGIDLQNPAQPVAHDPSWIPGSGTVVTATEKFLLVGTQTYDNQRWWDSTLFIFDIADPSGQVVELPSLPLGGRLQDKFKLDVSGNILTTITSGPQNADGSGRNVTTLRTYRLFVPTPTSKGVTTKLGSVEVGHGEQLFATRFDGPRAYIVTFLQIDPLWIVDLTDPANPTVLGELEIPGWSSYIHPLGDRLLTVGIDNSDQTRRTAVQLFDVANPSKPKLLSKVPLGTGWSWSEANADEKALGVFPDAGLVLVPYSSSDATTWLQGVQLIDLAQDTLTARGSIQSQTVVPRRTTLHGDRVLAISPRDLVTVDIANRDKPDVRGSVSLSYPIDRVVPVGRWLLEFSEGALRVRAAAEANGPSLAQLDLGKTSVVGATVRDDRVYLLQLFPATTTWKDTNWVVESSGSVYLTVLDATALPELVVLANAKQPTDDTSLADREALWPQPGLLAWAPQQSITPWMYYYRGGIAIDLAPTAPGLTRVALDATKAPSSVTAAAPVDALPIGRGLWWGNPWIYPWWSTSPTPIQLVDVRQPAQPQFLPEIASPKDAASVSRTFADGGLLYYSHDSQHSEVTGTNFWVGTEYTPVTNSRSLTVTNITKVPVYVSDPSDPLSPPEVVYELKTNVVTRVIEETTYVEKPVTNSYPVYRYWTEHHLNVVDLTPDPANPLVRPAVSLPGTLQGVSHGGTLLYTTASRADDDTNAVYRTWLEASAYDGLAAHLVSSLEIANQSKGQAAFTTIQPGGRIWVAQTDYAQSHTLSLLRLADTGKFETLDKTPLKDAPQQLERLDDAVAVQTGGALGLFAANAKPGIESLGVPFDLGCLISNLGRIAGDRAVGFWASLGEYGSANLLKP